MLDIIVCTVLMGLPNDNEVCYMTQTNRTEETFCNVAEGFAAARRNPLRVSYCRPAVEFDHPADVLAKLSNVTLVAKERARPLPQGGAE